MLTVESIPHKTAKELVVAHHYLHRAPQSSFCFGLLSDGEIVGVCIFGTPASRSVQLSACVTDPNAVMELNRLWVHDKMPRNTESWFVSRCLKKLPGLIVISYADTGVGHAGFIYRALNFRYAGWTDMERKTPRYDYVVPGGKHSRDAFRDGARNFTHKIQRLPKARYWITTGDRLDRRSLERLCTWPSLCWKELPPPNPVAELM